MTFSLGIRSWSTTTLLFEGFEEGLNGWQVGDNNPAGTIAYWGVVDSDFGGEIAFGGSNKLYCAATGYAGAISDPSYVGGMKAFLSRNLDLSGQTNATLSFWYKIPSIENVWDSAKVLIDNTEVWSRDTAQTNWTQVNLSLDTYVGGIHTLSFQFFTDFAVNFEGCYLDDILITDASIPGPPRTNDLFASAQPLIGANGIVTGNNRQATLEPGEPTSGFEDTNSVWFHWTTITNGQVTFSTEGSAFDTVVCVYSGTNLTTLTFVTSDDNGGSNNTSLITFDALAGVPYRVSIRGANNESGFIQLNWNQPNVILIDLLPDLISWADPAKNYLYGWYLDREQIPGHTLLRISTATANVGSGPLEIIGSSMTPEVQQRIYRNDGSFYDRSAGTFTFHPQHGHVHFDNWTTFNLRSVLPGDGVGAIVMAGTKTSSALIDLQIYDAALPERPASPQYHGGLVQGLSIGWADVYGANLKDQWIDVTGIEPGRYWLDEIVDPGNNILELNESNNVARILIELTQAALAGVSETNNYTNAPPLIFGQPFGTNLNEGATLRLSVTAGGWEPLIYQWQHSGTNLIDDARISGAGTATLSVGKISSSDAGSYTVIITNLYGSITSAPANLIVFDNPRAVYVEDRFAPVGGTFSLPINILAVGDEHELNFSLQFDPAVLTRPRVFNGADTSAVALSVNTNNIVNGRLGMSVAFPVGQAIAGGPGRELARVLFDIQDGMNDGATTFVGFGDVPMPRYVAATNGAVLHPVFAAGLIRLENVSTKIYGFLLPDGEFQVSLTGIPGRSYVLEAKDDLNSTNWLSVSTNQSSLAGVLQFFDSQRLSCGMRFYRTRLLSRVIE